jgi:hypothetical protein
LDSIHRTWGEVYPDWFKNHQNNRSEFEIYFDNRLAALLRQGLLSRVKGGLYKLNGICLGRKYDNEWTIIKGITLLPPQEGLEIPHMMFSG